MHLKKILTESIRLWLRRVAWGSGSCPESRDASVGVISQEEGISRIPTYLRAGTFFTQPSNLRFLLVMCGYNDPARIFEQFADIQRAVAPKGAFRACSAGGHRRIREASA